MARDWNMILQLFICQWLCIIDINIIYNFYSLFFMLCKVIFITEKNCWLRYTDCEYIKNRMKFLLPLPQTMILPLLSPVRTSPLWLNATQVTYLGFSLLSKMPIRLYSIPPLSRDQKDTCPFPQETIWFRSSGCHSAHTTVSTEHCNWWQSSFIK